MKEDGGVVVYDYSERLYRDAEDSFFLYIMGRNGKRMTNDEAILWIRNHASARDSRALLKWCFPIMGKEKKTGKRRRLRNLRAIDENRARGKATEVTA